MEIFKIIADVVSLLANLLTIVASTIAVYVFLAKGKEIKTAFGMLMNWSFQLTLAELKSKLERLNEYNASEQTEIDEIRNILHEIAGQVRGNRKLSQASPELADRVERLAVSKRLSEPLKRSMVSEVRENLRNIEVNLIVLRSE